MLLPARRRKKGYKKRKTWDAYKEKDERTESATTSSVKRGERILKAKKHGSVHRKRGQDGVGYLQCEEGGKDTKAKKHGSVHRQRSQEGKCLQRKREERRRKAKNTEA